MRGFDRDLTRGGHYGQRSCEPRKQAEHMAAPTNAAGVKRVLANPEPSTHGPSATSSATLKRSAYWVERKCVVDVQSGGSGGSIAFRYRCQRKIRTKPDEQGLNLRSGYFPNNSE